MRSEKFWLLFWMIIGITVIAITIVINYSMYQNSKLGLTYANKGYHQESFKECTKYSTSIKWVR